MQNFFSRNTSVLRRYHCPLSAGVLIRRVTDALDWLSHAVISRFWSRNPSRWILCTRVSRNVNGRDKGEGGQHTAMQYTVDTVHLPKGQCSLQMNVQWSHMSLCCLSHWAFNSQSNTCRRWAVVTSAVVSSYSSEDIGLSPRRANLQSGPQVSTHLKCPVSTPNLDGRLWKSPENYEVILDSFAVNFLPSYVIIFFAWLYIEAVGRSQQRAKNSRDALCNFSHLSLIFFLHPELFALMSACGSLLLKLPQAGLQMRPQKGDL